MSARSTLADLPYPERNVFLMIRFRSSDAHELLTSTIRATLERYGLNLVRADMSDFRETLWENVKFCMDACDFGIAVFDAIEGEAASPNVSLELGYMLAKERRSLLLKDKRLSHLEADLAGHLCQEFDVEAIPEAIPPPILKWLRNLGIRKREDERLVVFVSAGGTCRDPMAKAITEVLLRGRKTGGRIRLEAGALRHPSKDEVSRAARRAIKEMLGEDPLATHRPSRLPDGLIEDADLILVMDDAVLNEAIRTRYPPAKTHLLKRFFGSDGDIADPWPDGDDAKTNRKYADCAAELRAAIEPNLDRLIEFLESR